MPFHFDSFEEQLTYIVVMSVLSVAVWVWDRVREGHGKKDKPPDL